MASSDTENIYEVSMNERMRVYVRLEQLFQRIDHSLCGQSSLDMQATVMLILDLYAINSRTDVKRDLLKDLERQSATGIDHSTVIDGIHGMRGQANVQQKDNEFLNLIRQRSASTNFLSTSDLIAFDHWLKQPVENMRSAIHQWLAPYQPFRQAVESLLNRTRSSGTITEYVGEDGFFQTSLNAGGTPTMLRISLRDQPNIYPEISAGKLRVSLRFINFEKPETRGFQVDHNIDFCLQTCVI